jgi:hypothetical protein
VMCRFGPQEVQSPVEAAGLRSQGSRRLPGSTTEENLLSAIVHNILLDARSTDCLFWIIAALTNCQVQVAELPTVDGGISGV